MTRTAKIIAGVLVVVLLAAGGYYLYQKMMPQPQAASTTSNTAATDTPAAGFGTTAGAASVTSTRPSAPPAGYKEYTSATYDYSLYYPDTLTVTEYDEGNGAHTTTFESADYSQGFEIFVTPYSGSQVSAARFAMDEPSGTINEPTAITIGGVPATMFFGNNTAMGDTREVWFIRNGFLYEVATYKSADAWLSQIMATWQFTQ